MAAQLILSLSILVTLHELGHFMAARAFGIKVEKFYLFFDAWNFKFFSFTKGDTEYGIGWLPLGGYVKISGMIDESMDKEQMAQPPQPWEFRSKPAWQRLIVMVSGVLMNVILGIAVYSFSLLNYKQTYLPNSEVKSIYAYQLGKDIGLQDGDKIVAINGKPFERFEDVLSTRVMFGATLTVERNGQTFETVVPDNYYRPFFKSGGMNFIGLGDIVYAVRSLDVKENAFKAGLRAGDTIVMVEGEKIIAYDQIKNKTTSLKGKLISLQVKRNNVLSEINVPVNSQGLIGISLYIPAIVPKEKYQEKPYTLKSAIKFGASDAFESLVSNAKGLRKIFTGEEKASESIQGPIGIATFFGGTWNWARFWAITGLLSMVLAFMNMLPIPALDGGHAIFLLIEVITKKKFSDAFMERSQIVGMVILLSLMVFAIGNDIWKHVIN